MPKFSRKSNECLLIRLWLTVVLLHAPALLKHGAEVDLPANVALRSRFAVPALRQGILPSIYFNPCKT